MTIGIISDTHDNVANVLKAVDVFKEKRVDFVIHLGDVVAPGTIRFFKGIKLKVVLGNCDGDVLNIRKKLVEIGGEFLGESALLSVDGKKIKAVHGSNQDKLDNLIASRKFDYVLHGHTHKKRDEMVGRTRVINPGAHYWGSENTIAILDAKNDKLVFVCVDDIK